MKKKSKLLLGLLAFALVISLLTEWKGDNATPETPPETSTPEVTPKSSTPEPSTPQVSDEDFAQEVLALVNIERGKIGADPLVLDATLNAAAQYKSDEMVALNYVAHESPTYGSTTELLKLFDVTFSARGENIAAGQKTAVAVMETWMNSEGQRNAILNTNYTKLGVGMAIGGEYGNYWTQVFTDGDTAPSGSGTGNGSSSRSSASANPSDFMPGDTDQDGRVSQAEIHAVLDSYREKYPQGTPWTNSNVYQTTKYYHNNQGNVEKTGLYAAGCAGWVYMLLDDIYGEIPEYEITRDQLQVGDFWHTGSHWGMITEITSEGYLTTEGNFHHSIHWDLPRDRDYLSNSIHYYSRIPQ